MNWIKYIVCMGTGIPNKLKILIEVGLIPEE